MFSTFSKYDLKQIAEIVDQNISDHWYEQQNEAQRKDLLTILCNNDIFVNRIQDCYRNMEISMNQGKLVGSFASNIFPDVPTLFYFVP